VVLLSRLDFSVPALVLATALLAACSGGSSPATPSPTASPIAGVIASPSSLTFNATGFTQTITTAVSGGYTASGCTGVVTIGAFSGTALPITSTAGGTCTLTITYTATGQTASIPVTVTSVFLPVN
jgi:hypothetical protein